MKKTSMLWKDILPKGIPLYLAVSGIMSACMLLFFVLAMWGGFVQHRMITQSIADQTFATVTRSVKNMLESRLRPLRSLVDIGASLEPAHGGFSAECALLIPFFIKSLDINPIILTMNYSKNNGDFFEVIATRTDHIRKLYDAPESTAYILWKIEQKEKMRMDVREFRTSTYELLATRERKADYDPRLSPWYKDAMNSGSKMITHLYSLNLSNEMAIACAKCSRSQKSVFAIHVMLSDFNENLLSMPISQHGIILLLNSEQHLLAQSGWNFMWNRDSFNHPLIEHPDPALHAIALHIEQHKSTSTAHRMFEDDCFLSRSPINFGEDHLELILSAPVDDFEIMNNSFFIHNSFLIAGLFLLFLPIIVFFSWRVSRSLIWLTEDIEQKRDLPAKGISYADSPIREIRRLADALRDMIGILRERTSKLVNLQERIRKVDEKSIQKEAKIDIVPQTQTTLPAIKQSGCILSGIRLLMASSDPVNMQAMDGMLNVLEISMDTAKDGLETVEKAWIGNYDLILLDELLDGIDGLTLAPMLRKSKELQNVPIFLISNHAPSQEMKAKIHTSSLSWEIQEWLTKPIKADILRVALQHWFFTAKNAKE